MNRNGSSFAGRLLTTAAAALVAAVAVVWAVHLIVSVWVPLVVIGAVLVILGGIYGAVRARRSRW